VSSSPDDIERIADRVMRTCGGGRILDIGSPDGALVSALLRRGADAHGVDLSKTLPFEDESFGIVVLNAHPGLAARAVSRTLREVHRVTSRSLFVWIPAVAPGADPHRHAGQRASWEHRCFDAGFRKHPAYYKVNDYESLNEEGPLICIPLEKLPSAAREMYPLESLTAERGLHMDMLRDSGERSDAHVARYNWACGFIRPGDRVLDAACGLGYGGHVILELTDAESVLGIDDSEYAIDYASRSFTGPGERARYALGTLPQALTSLEHGSFEAIVCFETLEHLEDTDALLLEFHRLLSPGGRLVVSVPNDWSDESGKDPNPHHLQVYDWARLKRELGERFMLEQAFAQTASQCKVRDRGSTWERRSRALSRMELADDAPADCEWWLMVAMKSPLGASDEYRERVFRNIAGSRHPSIDYSGSFRNPWLMYAMVNVTYRLRNGVELENLAGAVMDSSPKDSNDYAAALCVKAYRVLDRGLPSGPESLELISAIDAVVARRPRGGMRLRWKVSLLFVGARLLQAMGRLDEARAWFEKCARQDVRGFGIHLSTKITEAWFLAGKIAYSLGNAAHARSCWEHGVEYGDVLRSASLDEILINRTFPNRFNHGDGVREFTVSWDNIARCANGLHLLSRGRPLDDAALESCFQTEYSVVSRELIEARLRLAETTEELVATRRTLVQRTEQLERAGESARPGMQDLIETRASLVERTRMLEAANADLLSRTNELVEARQTLSALNEDAQRLAIASRDLRERTDELVATRETLAERTRQLELAGKDLHERTDELVEIRETLAERTRQLERADKDLAERTRLLELSGKDLRVRTQELVQNRETLVERTRQLEAAARDLEERTDELVETRNALVERTLEIEVTRKDLDQRTDELVETRSALVERTREIEVIRKDLDQRTDELVDTRSALVERTREIEVTRKDLDQRTAELVETRDTLVERTRQLEATGVDLQERTHELVETRETLVERTQEIEATRKGLDRRTAELVETRDTLVERTRQLEAAGTDLQERTYDLVQTRETLVERTRRLEAVSADLAETARVLESVRARLEEIGGAPFSYALTATFRKLFK